MRLGKDDFNTLLNEPMLHWVDVDAGAQTVDRPGGRWLDVRLPSEFENLPFRRRAQRPALLRAPEAQDARSAVPYVVCCDTGRRSSAAAYILSERGFDAYVLKGGIAATDLAEALIGNTGRT